MASMIRMRDGHHIGRQRPGQIGAQGGGIGSSAGSGHGVGDETGAGGGVVQHTAAALTVSASSSRASISPGLDAEAAQLHLGVEPAEILDRAVGALADPVPGARASAPRRP